MRTPDTYRSAADAMRARILLPILEHQQTPADYDMPTLAADLIDVQQTPAGVCYVVDADPAAAWHTIEQHRRPALPCDALAHHDAIWLLSHALHRQTTPAPPPAHAYAKGCNLIEFSPARLATASVLLQDLDQVNRYTKPAPVPPVTYIDPHGLYGSAGTPLHALLSHLDPDTRRQTLHNLPRQASRLAWLLMRPDTAGTACITAPDGTHACANGATRQMHALAPWAAAAGAPLHALDGLRLARVEGVATSTARARGWWSRNASRWVDHNGRRIIDAFALAA